jgi:hypothetical protein
MADSKKIKWKRIGGGSHRLPNGTLVESGVPFDATPEEIPKAFRDVIVPVNPEELQALLEPPDIDPAPSLYSLKSRGPKAWDVVDGQGKVINEKPLTKAGAEELIKSLGG